MAGTDDALDSAGEHGGHHDAEDVGIGFCICDRFSPTARRLHGPVFGIDVQGHATGIGLVQDVG